MLAKWLKQRNARRAAELEARTLQARDAVDALVRDITEPLVEQGLARLEWTDPDPNGQGLEDGYVELLPRNPRAAEIGLLPDPTMVTLFLGPRGNSHEVWVDRKGEWEGHLRACLEAVIDGRYRESAAPGRVSRQVVTMTFEVPGDKDIVVTHHEYYELAPGEQEPPAERRFAAYSEVAVN